MVKVSVLLILIFTSLSYYLFFIEDNDSAQIKSSVTSSFDPNKKINYLGTGGGGWCNEIAVHPSNPNIVFVGSDNGGLFKSTNGGETWTRPMGALGSGKIFNFRVCGVIIDPLDPNIVWTATGAGPFKSSDLGETWKYMGGNGFPVLNQKNRVETNLSSVYVHPRSSNLIYLGVGGSAKHRTVPAGKYFEIGWRSTNGGQSWQALGKAGDAPNLSLPLGVSKIAFSAKDQNVVYFATNQGLYKSNDGGETWLKLLNIGVVRSVDVVKNNPNKVFCAINATLKDNPNNGIWYSNDGGQIWHHPVSIENVPYEKSYLGPKRCEWMQILDDNGKYVYAAIYGRLLQSTDGGMHWEFYNRRNQKPKSANSAFDQDGVGLKQFYIYEANRSFAYTDAVGLTFKTTNHGSNWNQTYGVKFNDGSWMNNGFVNTVAADLIIDNKNILVIDPDIGLNLSTDRGKSWRIIQTKRYIYGGSSITMDSSYYYVLFGSNKSGGLFRANRKDPFNWQLVQDFSGKLSDYTTMIFVKNNNKVKYFISAWSSKGGLYYSDSNLDFEKVRMLKQSRTTFIYADPNNPNNLYTGFSFNEGGGLYRSTNFGESWKRIDSDINGNDVSAIVVKPGDSNIIIKGVRGYSTPGKGGAYRSNDFGLRWQRIDSDIQIPYESKGKDQQRWVRSLSYTIDGKLIMAYTVASDAYWFPGIFISDNDGTTWKKLNTDGISGRMDKVVPDPYDANILWICTDGTGGVRYRIN